MQYLAYTIIVLGYLSDYLAVLADGAAATAAQMKAENDQFQQAALEFSQIDWDRLRQ
ncbi:MAG TPA: hypothetical protein VFB80_19860 [Pirellulaceae bacterium]|nr:hypothetical protein [Pirellulaceae bacterium]